MIAIKAQAKCILRLDEDRKYANYLLKHGAEHIVNT